MSTAVSPRILVVGGSGYFGRLLLRELLAVTSVHLIVGGRDEERLLRTYQALSQAYPGRLATRKCDLTDPDSIEPLLKQIQVAICAAGPYQALPLTLLELCMAQAVPYIDLSDDRRFVMRVIERVEAHPNEGTLPAICTGWSAVPALSAVMARIAAAGMERVENIAVHMAPGNRQPRAGATVASLLDSVGRPFTVYEDGAWREKTGWSSPRAFCFPQPVGKRVGYRVDVPDHQLFPDLFGAREVTFRVGAELPILNHIVSFMAWLSRAGLVRRWSRWAGLMQRGMALFGLLGSDAGAIGVEVSGRQNGAGRRVRVSVVGSHEGQRIAVMPAAIMAERLLEDASSYGGLVRHDDWLNRSQLAAECERRSLVLSVEEIAETY